MEPQIVIEHIRTGVSGMLSRIPKHLSENADRKTMWERMEALVSSSARSTNQIGEWWTTFCRRMIVDQSGLVADEIITNQLNEMLRIPEKDERTIEFWRQVRNESGILTALARMQWEESKVKYGTNN